MSAGTLFLTGIDAAVYTFPNDKIYLFSGAYYTRYTRFDTDAGYTKSLAGNFPGFPAEISQRIDIVLWSEPNYYPHDRRSHRLPPNLS